MLEVTQSLDRFANDFYHFLSKSSCNENSKNWNVKVIIVNDRTWTSIVPEHLRAQFHQSDGKDGARDLMIFYGRSCENWVQVPIRERRLAMRECGFTKEQIDFFSPYDILLFANSDYEDVPVPIQLGHLLLHVQEVLNECEIFNEEGSTHDFSDPATIELLLRFIEQMGEEEFCRRYRLRGN